MQIELRKLHGALRNDDAIWDIPWSWVQDGSLNACFLHGVAYKTKAMETTSVRIKEGMPWCVPLRGVCLVPSKWYAGHLDNLLALGMAPDSEYATPSPSNVNGGLKPPGAAEGEE